MNPVLADRVYGDKSFNSLSIKASVIPNRRKLAKSVNLMLPLQAKVYENKNVLVEKRPMMIKNHYQ